MGSTNEFAVCEPVSPVIVTVEPAARMMLVFNVTIIVLDSPKNTVLCSIDFTVKPGLITCNGLYPFVTPYKVSVLEDIKPVAIDPTRLPPSIIIAPTRTNGDVCSVAGLMRLKVKTQSVSETVPGDKAVSTSCPEIWFHAPITPNRLDVDDTDKVDVVAVCEPFSPLNVMVDPLAKLKLDLRVTVIELVALVTGLLC